MKPVTSTAAVIIVKAIISHSITYFFVGILAFLVFNYPSLYSDPAMAAYARSTNDPMVMAGPLFQPIRGLLFGIVFYLLREPFFGKPKGWLIMWITLMIVGIVSPFLGGPGSIEGLVYSRIPVSLQLLSLPEVFLQTLLLSVLVFHWVNHPQRWLNWVLGIIFFLVMFFPTLGLVTTLPK